MASAPGLVTSHKEGGPSSKAMRLSRRRECCAQSLRRSLAFQMTCDHVQMMDNVDLWGSVPSSVSTAYVRWLALALAHGVRV
mmetsp:Transcript_13683/g.41662  ORF Transcript_13683/g.41662 Transcript_13683/m.41662 type:complete len:82 (+) Transcript_13683:1699-1944(+)